MKKRWNWTIGLGTLGRRVLILAVAMAVTAGMSAQQAFVLCEGAVDFYSGAVLEAPRLGRVDLGAATPEFEVLQVFDGHAFAADVVLSPDGEEVFVAAEDTVFRMAAVSGDILASAVVPGARRLALAAGRLFVSRGDYDPLTGGAVSFEAYLVALDDQTLEWQAVWSAEEGQGPLFSAGALCAQAGALYVAINNAFNYGEEVGMIGRIDLATDTYSEVDLGPDGLNPVHLFPFGDAVISVNARQYEGTSLSRWAGQTPALTVAVDAATAGCGAAAVHEGGVLFQVYGEGDFRKADGLTLMPQTGWQGNGSAVYGMAPVGPDAMLLATTDFVSSGTLELVSLSDGLQWTLPVGVAPGRMVVGNLVSAIESPAQPRVAVMVYDVMGRPIDEGAHGVHIIRWSDGTSNKQVRLAD